MAQVKSDDIALGKARAASRGVKNSNSWISVVVGLVILVLILPTGFGSNISLMTTLSAVLFYLIMAQGWNLLGGLGGYLNFATALFMGVGAYFAAWLNNEYEMSLLETIIPAALAATLVSLVVGYATLRLRSHYFAIFTLILTFLGAVVAKNISSIGGGAGIYIHLDGDWTSESIAQYFFFMFLGLAVVASLIGYFVQNSNFGYALRAISEDEPAAEVLGIRTTDVKLRALLIGAALSGAAGAIYAFFTSYIEPTGVFNLDIALDIILVCVIGGMRSWLGPVIGAFIVVFLEQSLRLIIPSISILGASLPLETGRLLLGALLIIFALFFRQGIVGLFQGRRGRSVTV